MSQNTLKVHDLNEDAEFDENGVEVFDEKALVEEEPSDNDLAEEELLSQGASTASNPAFRAAAKRSIKGTSVNIMDKLAAKRGIALTP